VVVLVAAVASCALAAPAAGSSGGVSPGDPVVKKSPTKKKKKEKKKKQKKKRSHPPRLVAFRVTPGVLFQYGHAGRVRFLVRDRSRYVHVWLHVIPRGHSKATQRLDLGRRRTGAVHYATLPGSHLKPGSFTLRLTGRDGAGRGLHAVGGASRVDRLDVHAHRFPIVGSFSYNLSDGRFGVQRPGHVHQGQDMPSPQGTPIVAPRGGTIRFAGFDPGGGGNFVVLDSFGENLNFVFMHMRTGSVRVRTGERVRTGQRIGDVGSTGHSTGPHLHFEVWVGPWQAGGHAVDPLSYLRRWDRWS
jgi:murein DD-endopeptidase MepM/ murein hydrolase activator NlpD